MCNLSMIFDASSRNKTRFNRFHLDGEIPRLSTEKIVR